nr:nascent polypeptide-associated complex subunit alpha, muscle-specific form-like [Equus caballus]
MNPHGGPPPRSGGKRPLPHCRAEQSGRLRRSRERGLGPTHRVGWCAGPLGCSAGTAGPAPAPPRPGKEPRNGHPPPPASRANTPGRTPDKPRAVPEPRHLGGSKTLDSGSHAAARGRGSTPPAQRGQQVRARRLPGRAVALSPRRAALRILLPSLPPPERPRLPPAGLAGGPADSAPASPAPAPRSRPAPRPGHARWPTRGLGNPEGAVPARKRGLEEPREGHPSPPPFTAAPGLLGSSPSWTRFPFHKRGDGEAERWPFAARQLRAGRAVSDLAQSSSANAPSLFNRGGNWGLEKGSHLLEDTRRLEGDPGRRDLGAAPARKFPASALAALPAFSPAPAFVSPPPTLPRVAGVGRGAFDIPATCLPIPILPARPASSLCKPGSPIPGFLGQVFSPL